MAIHIWGVGSSRYPAYVRPAGFPASGGGLISNKIKLKTFRISNSIHFFSVNTYVYPANYLWPTKYISRYYKLSIYLVSISVSLFAGRVFGQLLPPAPPGYTFCIRSRHLPQLWGDIICPVFFVICRGGKTKCKSSKETFFANQARGIASLSFKFWSARWKSVVNCIILVRKKKNRCN